MRSSSASASAAGPSSARERVGVHEVEERRGDRAVLRLAALEQHVLPRGDRDARRHVHSASRADVRRRRSVRIRRRDEQTAHRPSARRRTKAGALGKRGADADLAGVGDSLDHRRLGGDRACDEQLAVDAAHEEEVDRSRSRFRSTCAATTRVLPTRTRPTRSIVFCISQAARAARCSWPAPSKRSSIASPPHLSRPAPHAYASSSSAQKIGSSVSRSSSAPIFPRRLRLSVSAVKPEMSTNASDPSTARCVVSRRVAQPLDLQPRNVRLQYLALIVERRQLDSGHRNEYAPARR